MIVMLNGSFGVGKTTVARLLRGSLAGSVIYDPEWTGWVLMRLPGWVHLRGMGRGDFQHVDLWRSSVVAGIRLFRRFASGPVIVPMTFTSRAYFDEIVGKLRPYDPGLKVFCLRASLPAIRRRLMDRGTPIEGPDAEWIGHRILECAEAHRDIHFGEPVDTEDRAAREVAADILDRLRDASLSGRP
jgi:hypothetical protein